LKYISHFSYSMTGIILVKICSSHPKSSSSMSCKELSKLNSKLFKSPKVHNIFIKFGAHILSKFWNAKNILCDNNFGGLWCAYAMSPHFIFQVHYCYRVLKNVNIGYEVGGSTHKIFSQGMNVGWVFVNFTSIGFKCPHLGWYLIGVWNDFWYPTHVCFDLWPMGHDLNCGWTWIKVSPWLVIL